MFASRGRADISATTGIDGHTPYRDKRAQLDLRGRENIKGIASRLVELRRFLPWSESNGAQSPGLEC
jgi:hypothetical protein